MPRPTNNPRSIINAIKRRSQQAADSGMPWWGQVTSTSNEKVAVTHPAATTNATELISADYAQTSVGDYGIVLPVEGGGSFFIRAAESTDIPIIPVSMPSEALMTVTNTATMATKITQNTFLEVGTYGCVIFAEGLAWRSVNTGQIYFQVTVGGYTSDVRIVDQAVIPKITTPVPVKCSVLRSQSNSPIVVAAAGNLAVAVTFRGGTTAGNTNLANVECYGYFYRIF